MATSAAASTAGLVAGLSAVSADPAVADVTNPYRADVVVAQAADGQRAYFPGLAETADGGLIAAYREGDGHIGQDGRILVTTSADAGRSWSEPAVAVDSEYDERDPKIMLTSDGTLLMSFFVTDWSNQPYDLRGTYVTRSEDNGRTWSEPVEVGTAMDCSCGAPAGDYHSGFAASHGAVTELPNDDLLIPLYGVLPDHVENQATVVRSTDGGRTWSADTESVIGVDNEFSYQEPTLVVLEDQVVALLRTTKDLAYLSRSFDNGRTWSTPEQTDLPASSHDVLRLASGGVLLTYGDLSERYSPGRPTVGTIIEHPERSWNGQAPTLLYDSSPAGVTFDQANPASVELEPGHFLTLTYDIHQRTLVGVFTRTADYRPDDPPPPGQLDLAAMEQAGELTVETNLTWTSQDQPTRGPSAPLDGVPTFFHSATLDQANAPGEYVIRFAEPQPVRSLGTVLKPNSSHTAELSVTTDGTTWTQVATVEDAPTIEPVWNDLDDVPDVTGIRVAITDTGGGWPQLTELAVLAPR